MLNNHSLSKSAASVDGRIAMPSRPVRIRLLVVNHGTLYGGAEKILKDLLRLLPPEEVQILAIVAPGQGPARVIWEGIGVRCIDLPVPYFARAPFPYFEGTRLSLHLVREISKWTSFRQAFHALLRQEAPDLVYASSPHAAIAIEPVLRQFHMPWIWQMPDLIGNRWLNRRALRPALRNAQAIMTLSTATSDSIIQLGADSSKIHRVYGGVDVARFDSAAPSAAHYRAAEGISADVPLIGMFGQVTRWKGWHILVEAIPRVLADFPAARFVFVGQPPTKRDCAYQAALQRRLAALGLEHSVRWTGFREDVEGIMAACDIIVHASVRPEPLGLVIMEGMAARKPVICASGGGTEEMVTHNETGLVVSPGNPGELADALNRLLSDPSLRTRFGEKGREVAAARFTHDRRVEAYLKVFHRVVEIAQAKAGAANALG